jgi:hypothetical protein
LGGNGITAVMATQTYINDLLRYFRPPNPQWWGFESDLAPPELGAGGRID